MNLTVPVAGTGGYGGGGVVKPAYRGQNVQPAGDAFQDLSYNLDRPAGNNCTATSYRKILADNPTSAHAAGWYVEMYNSAAGAAAPVVGFYIGRASQQLYSAVGPSLPGIYSSNAHFITGAKASGIQVDTVLLGPDGSTPCGNRSSPGFTSCEAVVHRNWAIFTSTQADLQNPSLHQPIADEQNCWRGSICRGCTPISWCIRIPSGGCAGRVAVAVPDGGGSEAAAELGRQRHGGVRHADLLRRAAEQFGGVAAGSGAGFDVAGNSAAAVQTALNSATGLAASLENTLASGDNHFDNRLGYYQLGLKTSPETVVLNAILMNANTTAAQKTLAKAALALFGSIFWDDDWFPIDNNSGESDGLANQIQQYLEYRAQSVFSNSVAAVSRAAAGRRPR